MILSSPSTDEISQVDQPVLVDLIYNKSLEGGFFIEAGAWDGEFSILKVAPLLP